MKEQTSLISKIFVLILVFGSIIQPVYAGGETDINQGLKQNAGGVYTLPAGNIVISDTIQVPDGTTFEGTIGPNGDLLTTITLVDDASLSAYQPLVNAGSHTTIRYIKFDANSMHQGRVPTKNGKNWGQGYDNVIKFEHQTGIEVYGCEFCNGLGDGLRAINSNNIKFHDNKCWKLGHDSVFCIRSEGIWIYNNYIQPRTTSGIRGMDISHARIWNNTINYVHTYDGVPYDAGPNIQMQLDQGPFTDVQITGNRLYNSCGPGFWIVDKIGGEGQLDISWNLVYGCGSNHGIYWAAGVISNGFDEYFSHNVFDSCYLGSFVSYDVNSGWETSATSTFDSNIFTNTQPGTYSGDGGYGIYNKIGQNIVSQNNCFWQNSAGDVKGCSISSTDIHVDPKTTATPSGWRYVNGQWECDMVQPLPMDEIAGINNSYKPITEKEIQEEDIFLAGLLTVEFPENAITRQSGDSINYNVPTQQVGDVAGGVKIVGFNNWSKIDNENFISSTNDVLVKSVVMRNQDLDMYTANPKKIDKTVTVDMNNTTVTATLTAKVSSPSQKNILIGNKTTGKTKTRKYTFTDTYSPAPKILPQPAEVTGVIYQYPTKFELNVLGENYTEIEYKVGENITKHTFMIGARNETDTGVDFTEYTRIEFWDDNNSIPHIGDWISVPGKYDPETVKVTAKTPYKEYQVNKFEIVDKKFPEKDKIIAWWVYPKMVFYILCACYIGYLLSRIKNH